MKNWTVLIIFCFFANAWAGPAILVEEIESKTTTKQKIQPISQRAKFEIKNYSDSYELRSHKRVGAGMLFGGYAGMVGVVSELNFSPEDSVIAGFGGGPRYNAFTLGWKHSWASGSMTPYTGVAYSYWYSSLAKQDRFEKSNPGFLASKILTEDEKRNGQFGRSLLVPFLGVQFYQLSGAASGTSIFAEIEMITALEDLKPNITGALGAVYFF
jgi:hypothetical protein